MALNQIYSNSSIVPTRYISDIVNESGNIELNPPNPQTNNALYGYQSSLTPILSGVTGAHLGNVNVSYEKLNRTCRVFIGYLNSTAAAATDLVLFSTVLPTYMRPSVSKPCLSYVQSNGIMIPSVHKVTSAGQIILGGGMGTLDVTGNIIQTNFTIAQMLGWPELILEYVV